MNFIFLISKNTFCKYFNCYNHINYADLQFHIYNIFKINRSLYILSCSNTAQINWLCNEGSHFKKKEKLEEVKSSAKHALYHLNICSYIIARVWQVIVLSYILLIIYYHRN